MALLPLGKRACRISTTVNSIHRETFSHVSKSTTGESALEPTNVEKIRCDKKEKRKRHRTIRNMSKAAKEQEIRKRHVHMIKIRIREKKKKRKKKKEE